MIIVTSTYAKNQHLTVEVGDVSFNSPIGGKPRANISKFSLSRSNLTNVERIRYSNI